MAPDEMPTTYTRLGSAPRFCTSHCTMERTPAGSLLPLWVNAPADETSQHLVSRTTDGKITMNPYWSAIIAISRPLYMSGPEPPHQWAATRIGALAGTLSGTYSYILMFVGL